MEYDEDRLEYYATLDDVLENTLLDSNDLSFIFGSNINKGLKILSHNVYRLIYDYYKGINKNEHITFMQRKIANNQYNEQTYLLNAIIELVRGVVQSGVDLNAYNDEYKSKYPETVYEELRNGKLLDKRNKINY